MLLPTLMSALTKALIVSEPQAKVALAVAAGAPAASYRSADIRSPLEEIRNAIQQSGGVLALPELQRAWPPPLGLKVHVRQTWGVEESTVL